MADDAAQETMTSSEFEVVGDAAQVTEAPDQAQPAAQQVVVSEASLARTRLEESVLKHGVRIAPGILVCVLRTCSAISRSLDCESVFFLLSSLIVIISF